METVSNSLSQFNPQDQTADRSLLASRNQLAEIAGSRSLDPEPVTEEGDKVTLSIGAQASAAYDSNSEVNSEDDFVYTRWGEYSGGQYEREERLTVEGDLNRQEHREIRKVIKTINRMMHNFVSRAGGRG